MGPTCEILVEAITDEFLDRLDTLLAERVDQMERTRKGRVWRLQVSGRPIDVGIQQAPPAVNLAAGCNGPEDYASLTNLAAGIAIEFQGIASEPSK